MDRWLDGNQLVINLFLKARSHTRLLSRQLDAIFVAPKLHQVSNISVRNPCDIAATNRSKHRTWFTLAILKLQQKLHRVAATKIACVNGPLARQHFTHRLLQASQTCCSNRKWLNRKFPFVIANVLKKRKHC